MAQFDFIAIGDTVTDEFIELEDVRIDTDKDPEDKGYQEICFRFGDKVAYKDVVTVYAVGNAANAAVSATRLGLKTAYIADIGDDELGEKKLNALKKNGVDTEFVRKHPGFKSNFHYVLRYGPERTILIKHAEFPYSLPTNLEPPRWIYFSSVGKHGLEYHHEIATYLKNNPETKLAFQPGSFQINVGYEAIKDIYAVSEIFFCNKEEAGRILATQSKDTKEILKGIQALGPKMVVITDGPNGAYAFEGDSIWYVPMYPDVKNPIDRTGAGDAFASTITSALALGMPLQDALLWGPVNSMNVVQYIGAQEGLLRKKELLRALENKPDSFKVEKIG